MNHHLATAILHMQEPLDGQRRKDLEQTMREDAGVVSVDSSEHLPRVLLVAYDTEGTSSGNIIRRMTRAGLHARLVGCG